MLDNLNKFTRYAIIVQAFNSKGTGSPSNPIVGATLADGNENFFVFPQAKMFLTSQYLCIEKKISYRMATNTIRSISSLQYGQKSTFTVKNCVQKSFQLLAFKILACVNVPAIFANF